MTSVVTCDPAAVLDRYGAIKARQQAMWASGDFAVIGTTIQIVGELLCEGVDLRAGERVLDVAAGNGNATLAAARRFASVTSTDYVPALLERGRRRAEAEGLEVTFQPADAEALPYPAASFDVVAFRYRSPEHWIEVFRAFYGPVHKAFAALDGEHQRALEADLLTLLRQSDRGGAAGLVVPGEYLETVITR